MNAFDADIARLRAKYPPFVGCKAAARLKPPRAKQHRAADPEAMPLEVAAKMAAFCSARNVELQLLTGDRGSGRIHALRDEAMAIVAAIPGPGMRRRYPLRRIGRFFGGRDPSTIKDALRRHAERVAQT